MLEATAQAQQSVEKVHREMRNSLESFSRLIDPRINATQLADSLYLQRVSNGNKAEWNQDLQRQTLLVGRGTRTGEYLSLKDLPMQEHAVVSVSLLCPVSNAHLARTFSLENGRPCKTSRMVELNFTHTFIEQVRQKFLAQANADVTIADMSAVIIKHIATAGFEVLQQSKVLEAYQLLGSNTLIKADSSAKLSECHFFTLNLHIGIVGGAYAVHWADSYCFSETGHLSLFGI